MSFRFLWIFNPCFLFAFIQLYKEKLYDLLSVRQQEVEITEGAKHAIKILGVCEIHVTSSEEALTLLEKGSLKMKVGATANFF